jgi:hypothetical protein
MYSGELFGTYEVIERPQGSEARKNGTAAPNHTFSFKAFESFA